MYEAVWLGAYSTRTFEWLVWFGAIVGVVPRFRLGLCAFLATLVVVAPIAPSSGWIPALHRLVPTCAVQTIVAGMGAYALGTRLAGTSTRRTMVAAPAAGLALWLLFQTYGELSEPHPFTVEYDIVRAHLAPRGVPVAGCSLLAWNPAIDTLDLHDIAQVVPQIPTFDCSRVDCLAQLRSGGCVFYFRTTTAYLSPGGVPPDCTPAIATSPTDSAACLSAAAARLESAMEMTPVETRVVRLADKIPIDPLPYPPSVRIGLFRVGAR